MDLPEAVLAPFRPTSELIEALRALSWRSLPGDVRVRAKDLVLDHLGVALYGARFDWCRIVRTVALKEGDADSPSSIYGGGRTSARNAALANATAAHAVSLDDTHDEALSHPGSVIIPAAIAVAEQHNCSGDDFLAAVVAGYEAQCRFGLALGKRLLERGFHPTAQLGIFGAAATAGYLLRFQQREFESAFGLAGSMASGITKYLRDPEGTMVKRLHAGMPAERGLLAASLAAEGFTGPRGVIEGEDGFANILANERDLTRITSDLGKRFEILHVTVKFYSCHRMFHSLIDAAVACRRDAAVSLDDIIEIEAYGPAAMAEGHMERRPKSLTSAQYSVPYTVALALQSDPTRPELFDPGATGHLNLTAIMDKIVVKTAPDLEAIYPAKLAGRVRLKTRTGLIERTVLDSHGTPARPVAASDIERKFRVLTADVLSQSQQDAVADAVTRLDEAPDLSPLMRTLTSGGPA